jgi:pyrroline-5-carboxylate reductase
MKIGIIGLGNIGGMLAKRFAEFLSPSDIIVFDKHKKLGNKYSWVNSAQEVMDKSEIVFLCVKPQNLQEFTGLNLKNKIFITTIAAIYENSYYKYLGKIKLIRIIPSMINKIGGPILFNSGKYINSADRSNVKKLLSKVGNIYEVKEKEIDAYTHLSSCSPAIFAEFLKLYIEALMEENKINEKRALKIVVEMLEIFVPVLKKDGFKIIPQVCTKGGITEQGIKIIDNYKNSFFKELTRSLLKRIGEVRKQYGK